MPLFKPDEVGLEVAITLAGIARLGFVLAKLVFRDLPRRRSYLWSFGWIGDLKFHFGDPPRCGPIWLFLVGFGTLLSASNEGLGRIANRETNSQPKTSRRKSLFRSDLRMLSHGKILNLLAA